MIELKNRLAVLLARPNLYMISILILCSLFPSYSFAYETGTELATAVSNRPDGDDAFSTGVMALVEQGHKPRIRQLVTFRQDKPNGDTVSLIRFKKPADIKDTGLLTIDYEADIDTDQWIYLPAVDKARRVSSKRKGGRFVGSDIFYEDLRERKVSADSHRILGEETFNGMKTTILESIPTAEDNSVYGKRISWINEQTLLAVKMDLYEKNSNKPSKRMLIKQIEKKQGFWTAMKSVVRDLKTGHETHMKIDNISYDQNLSPEIFTQKFLSDPQREKSVINQLTGKQ